MKKIRNMLVVALLSGTVQAAGPSTVETGNTPPDRGPIEKSTGAAGAKPKVARKPTNSNGPAQATDASKRGFRKRAKDINRPGPTPDVAPTPEAPAPATR